MLAAQISLEENSHAGVGLSLDPAPESNFHVAYQTISDFIHQLPHANDLDKAWDLSDAEKRLKAGDPLEKLKEKYVFYDRIAAVRDQILQNIPAEKRGVILGEINKIVDESMGSRRYLKMEKLQRVEQVILDFLRDQTLLKHKLWRTHSPPSDVGTQILKVLITEDDERFKKEYEAVFTPKFWDGIYGIFSKDCPHVVKAFPFLTENDFLSGFMSLDQLKGFLENLKNSAQEDAKHMLRDFFSDSDTQKQLSKLNALSLQKPARIVKFLHEIHGQKENHRLEAKQLLARAQSRHLSGDCQAAKSEIDALEKKQGKNVIRAIGGQKFMSQLFVDLANEERIKKEIKSARGVRKEKLRHKLTASKKGKVEAEFDEKDEAKKEKQVQDISVAIKECLGRNDFSGARAAARRLRNLDRQKENQEIKKINEALRKSKEEEDTDESKKVDISIEKQKKIKFLEKCIEHMKKVFEQCDMLGIPKDDPNFWGIPGIRGRVAWLKKNGMFETYKKFNASDPHVPSTAQAGGFKFRWLDLKMGTSLTISSAESGIGFLDRFKESGYALAALAGAFSINWKGVSDPVYSPVKFMSLVRDELGRVKGR